MSNLKRGGRNRRVPGYNDKIRPKICVAAYDGRDGNFLGILLRTMPFGDPVPFLDIVIRGIPRAFALQSNGDQIPAIGANINEVGGIFVEFPEGTALSAVSLIWPAWDDNVRLTTGEWLPPIVFDVN